MNDLQKTKELEVQLCFICSNICCPFMLLKILSYKKKGLHPEYTEHSFD